MILKLITIAILTFLAFDTFNSTVDFSDSEKYVDVSFDTESLANTYIPFLHLSTSTEPYCLVSYKTAGKTLDFKCDK